MNLIHINCRQKKLSERQVKFLNYFLDIYCYSKKMYKHNYFNYVFGKFKMNFWFK